MSLADDPLQVHEQPSNTNNTAINAIIHSRPPRAWIDCYDNKRPDISIISADLQYIERELQARGDGQYHALRKLPLK